MKRFGREAGRPLYVSSKIEIMPDDVDDIAGKIVASTEASLRRLQVDCIDVMMIHNPPRSTRDPSAAHWLPLTPADMLGPALDGLERECASRARCAGLDLPAKAQSPALQRRSFLRAAITRSIAGTNMVNPTAGMKPDGVRYGSGYDDYDGVITHAGECGVGVAVIRPLSGGALTPQVIERAQRAGTRTQAEFIHGSPPPSRPRSNAVAPLLFCISRRAPCRSPHTSSSALEHDAVSTVVAAFPISPNSKRLRRWSALPRSLPKNGRGFAKPMRNNFHLEPPPAVLRVAEEKDAVPQKNDVLCRVRSGSPWAS